MIWVNVQNGSLIETHDLFIDVFDNTVLIWKGRSWESVLVINIDKFKKTYEFIGWL